MKNVVRSIIATMARVREGTTNTGCTGMERVRMHLVINRMNRNTARAWQNVRWVSEGRSVATHVNARSAANKRSKVATQNMARRDGKTRRRRKTQNSTLLIFFMNVLARAGFNAQRMPSRNFRTTAIEGSRVGLVSKSSARLLAVGGLMNQKVVLLGLHSGIAPIG